MPLNPQQRAAVEHPPGPVMVTAGPGTGKTRVLAQRVAHLVRTGAAPETVLAVAFTRQAAREMQARLAETLPNGSGAGITVCTFHALELTAANAVDFDDLLALPARILLSDRDARAHWGERYAHVLVDEFQDTNPLQYVLVQALIQGRDCGEQALRTENPPGDPIAVVSATDVGRARFVAGEIQRLLARLALCGLETGQAAGGRRILAPGRAEE